MSTVEITSARFSCQLDEVDIEQAMLGNPELSEKEAAIKAAKEHEDVKGLIRMAEKLGAKVTCFTTHKGSRNYYIFFHIGG